MNSWEYYNKILLENAEDLHNPVEEALNKVDFKLPHWNERRKHFKELKKRFKGAFDDDLLILIKKMDWYYYRYYVFYFYPKFSDEIVKIIQKQAQNYQSHVEKYLAEKSLYIFKGTHLLPKLANSAKIFQETIEYSLKLRPKSSIQIEIFNLYSNLLVTNPRHKGGGIPLINLNRIENYVRKKQGMDPAEKVDLDYLAKLKSDLLLEALNTVSSPVKLPIDQATVLWIARFFRNFEVCYELPERLFNFSEEKHELDRIKDKLLKIINRCYSEEGVKKNLQEKLRRWGVHKIKGKYCYRVAKK